MTTVLSALALYYWTKFARLRISNPVDLADAGVSDWPALISMILPRPARRIWHGFVLLLAMLVPAILHIFALRAFWLDAITIGMYLFYIATLALWLASLALPAIFIVSHRQPRAQEALMRENGGR